MVRQPCLLLARPQHTDTGLVLPSGIGKAGLHQPCAIAVTLRLPGNPQTVQIEIVFPLDGHPCRLQRGILDESTAHTVQLAQYMSFWQSFLKPPALGFHAGMGLFPANNAA